MLVGSICRLCFSKGARALIPQPLVNRQISAFPSVLVNRNFATEISVSKVNDTILNKTSLNKGWRRNFKHDENSSESFSVVAYATAESYNLSALLASLKEQTLYIPSELTSDEPLKTGLGVALHTIAKYRVSPENRHIYYFEEGAVVMWNVNEFEQKSIMKFLRQFEHNSYAPVNINEELETMSYYYNPISKKSLIHDGRMAIGILDKNEAAIAADRYTLSNAMSLSVKLGIYELMLGNCIEYVEELTDDLRIGKPLRFGRADILQKSGQIFALKHSLNLSTDLLDTPEFYWEQEHLEALYKRACYYFSIPRRTKVLNEKISNCVDLMQLVSTHLTDQHHVQLEWTIIILIAIELLFEIIQLFV